jgi:hypothetical protein
MKKELIPIVAAYWGQKCSYGSDDAIFGRKPFNWWDVKRIESSNNPFVEKFKLHLRQLFSITKAELKELAVVMDIQNPEIQIFHGGIYESRKSVKERGYDSVLFNVDSDNYYRVEYSSPSKVINFLRAKGFCVDSVLVEEGLVQWIENN